MKQLENEINSSGITPLQCGREMLDVLPLIMRKLHSYMRNKRKSEVSEPQFRVLIYVKDHPDASLSEVAEFWGLSHPSMSKLIDGLVEKQMLTRLQHPGDRRRIQLALTTKGFEILEVTHRELQLCLTNVLDNITAEQRLSIFYAMQQLRGIFQPDCQTGIKDIEDQK